ncbi:TPA: hypothetical protein N0F65_000220 [Lagenidium giganteum]|uniref:Protein kinase domain-containing protein n=1 Tax=Lagenidium giganteum TaxID=4803 RepID=A0AAV2YF66_9STRA|nr:TPA: hypothetical protein N0F65_000220 [Lagenidium giganteum]
MVWGPGAAFWAVPEVLKGQPYSEKADVYSFSVVLNELDTCARPFENYRSTMQPLQIIRHVIDDSIQLDFTSSCPQRVEAIAQAYLAVLTEDRPRAHEIVAELEQIR